MIPREMLPDAITCRCGDPAMWATHLIDDGTGYTWGLLFTCDTHRGCQGLPLEEMGMRPLANEIIIKIGPLKEVGKPRC